MKPKELQQQLQRLSALIGLAGVESQSVLRGELQGDLLPALHSRELHAGEVVSVVAYNELLADVHALHARLSVLDQFCIEPRPVREEA